ncbi:hypothetical protein VTO42DRAFT_1623 [Malbranchea cinnamomea]
MPRRQDSSAVSDTSESDQTVSNANENSSTPATSPELMTNAEDNEAFPKSTRRRVTRSSLNLAVNSSMGDKTQSKHQLQADPKIFSSNQHVVSHSRVAPFEGRSSRAHRSKIEVSQKAEDNYAPGMQGTLENEDYAAQDEPFLKKDNPILVGALAKQQLTTEWTEKRQGEWGAEKVKGKVKPGNEGCIRRSTRISLLNKAKESVEKTSSVLGKRSRRNDQDGATDRRASLRPRNLTKSLEKKTTAESFPTKSPRSTKAKSSTSKLPVEETQVEKPKSVPFKRKRWLTHGLYAGQYAYSTEKPPEDTKNRRRKKQRPGSSRVLLPMPMYSGARLLETGRDFKLPFDIFSPLPPGQPKPDEWRKTSKNVFVGEAASIWKAMKVTGMSTCTCTPETGCDENCQNRCMFYECDDTNCKLGEELCGNRSFSELRQRCKAGGKYNIGVEVIKTADRGYGVRSNRTFEPNQIIVEYTGEIITREECERRMRTIYKNNDCYYLMDFDQNMIIDATRGSIARFVNHSCEPNCRMEKWTVAGKPRVALFAGENGIMTGEELTYDYNFNPYSLKNVQECRCGAPTCRGILGPRPKDGNRNKDDNDKQKTGSVAKSTGKGNTLTKSTSTGRKRKAKTVLDESMSRLNKKRTAVKLNKSPFKKGGEKKTVSRLARSTTKAKARKTDQSARTSVKRASKTKQAHAKEKKTSKGSKRPKSVGSSKLRMPSKFRLANSISAARVTGSTPASTKKSLEKRASR